MPALGRLPGTQVFRRLDAHPEDETFPGIAVVRHDGGVFFATADAFHDRIREVVNAADPPLHDLVLDLEAVTFVDSQGAAKLAEVSELLGQDGINVRLARARASVRSVLDRQGLTKLDVHGTVADAVQAAQGSR